MAKRRRRRKMGSLAEDLGLDGLLGLGAIDGIAKDAIDLGIMGASGIGGYVLAGLVANKTPWLKEQSPWIKAGVVTLAGIGAGIGLGKYVHQGVGAGVGVGMLVYGLGGVLIPYLPEAVQPGALPAGVAGLGYTSVTEVSNPILDRGFAGLGLIQTEEVPAALPFQGLGTLTLDEMSPEAAAALA